MSDEQKDKKSSEPSVDSAASESTDAAGSSRDFTVDALRRYLSEKLRIFDSTEPEEKVKVLSSVSVDGIVEYMKSKNCNNIITMAGAGISTSAGIPDFRSPESGLYNNLQKYNLPHPQAIFELDFFQDNPKPFFVLAKELYPGTFKPTTCHYFIKMLEDKGYLLRHYSQNIDTLERVAGISEEKLVEAHGTFYTGRCLLCQREYPLEYMRKEIFDDKIPTCEKCSGVVKPDIVFFGENLPDKFHKCLKGDFTKCDLLLILGTSLAVQPFASLVDRVSNTTPRLLINREKAGERNGIMAMIGIGGGLDFDSEDNTRDVFWAGECDEGCQLLADKLGWGEELRKLVQTEYKRIDSEKPSPVSKEVTEAESQKQTVSKEVTEAESQKQTEKKGKKKATVKSTTEHSEVGPANKRT